MQILEPGQIRHPKKIPESLLKCTGPHIGETWDENGLITPVDIFLSSNYCPKPHYFVIERIIENHLHPEIKYCLVYIITHSFGYNNLKINDDCYSESLIKLSDKSYITRDKFLITTDYIATDKLFGVFHLDKLKSEIDMF